MLYDDVSSAELMHQQLEEQITEAEDSLENDEKLEIIIVGAPEKFILDAVGFSAPEMILFYGHIYEDNAGDVRLLQHVSQVNLYLKLVKRESPEAPRKKIQFSFESQED